MYGLGVSDILGGLNSGYFDDYRDIGRVNPYSLKPSFPANIGPVIARPPVGSGVVSGNPVLSNSAAYAGIPDYVKTVPPVTLPVVVNSSEQSASTNDVATTSDVVVPGALIPEPNDLPIPSGAQMTGGVLNSGGSQIDPALITAAVFSVALILFLRTI